MKALALISLASSLTFTACTTTSNNTKETRLNPDEQGMLADVIHSQKRVEKNRVRDNFRHPKETLQFFGIKPDMTVVEVWPGGGWYAEILAPYLKGKGQYVAAGFSEKSEVEYYRKSSQKFRNLVANRSDEFGGNVKISEFEPPQALDIIAPGTADAVLTFRNIHNWMHGRDGNGVKAAFTAFYKALKPGGILGVVEHRASDKVEQDPQAKSGYVRQDYVISIAEKAGFELVTSSEINSNPKDTKDHPKGVWTLPPVLALKDKNKEKYVAIGESDRMTLKFVKPQ